MKKLYVFAIAVLASVVLFHGCEELEGDDTVTFQVDILGGYTKSKTINIEFQTETISKTITESTTARSFTWDTTVTAKFKENVSLKATVSCSECNDVNYEYSIYCSASTGLVPFLDSFEEKLQGTNTVEISGPVE